MERNHVDSLSLYILFISFLLFSVDNILSVDPFSITVFLPRTIDLSTFYKSVRREKKIEYFITL